MCVTFDPIKKSRIQAFVAEAFNALVLPESVDYPSAVFPGYSAPFIRARAGAPEWALGRFGLIPRWAKDEHWSKYTYNARSETVADKPSFRQSWHDRQFCLVPMMLFREPKWAGGKSTRVAIGDADG